MDKRFDIPMLQERKRGCGYRKPGGLYLMGDVTMQVVKCGKLPLALTTCPVCGGGIRRSPWPRWVNACELFRRVPCDLQGTKHHAICWLNPLTLCGDEEVGDPALGKRALLIWIGEGHYSTPRKFFDEAEALGISRRIAAIPRGFVVGETLVLFAHVRAIAKGEPIAAWDPGIISAFVPDRIEYVVKLGDTEKKLARLVGRGVTLVRVERVGQEPAKGLTTEDRLALGKVVWCPRCGQNIVDPGDICSECQHFAVQELRI